MKLSDFNISQSPVQCGCCDYFSISSHGFCQIYPVCYWEDDLECVSDTQIDLDHKSDVNNDVTLREARANFKNYGAWSEKFVDIVIPQNERDSLEYVPRNP